MSCVGLMRPARLAAVLIVAAGGPLAAGQNLSVKAPALLAIGQERIRSTLERIAADRSVAAPAFFQALVKADAANRLASDVPVTRIVFPQAVFFDTDSADIRPEAAPALAAVAEALRRDTPKVAVFVAGHTDSRGTDAHNYPLSVARADAVGKALKAIGVGGARLWRVGFGQTLPLASNATPEGMARNRRVEFILAADPKAVAVWLARELAARCAAQDASGRDCRAGVALAGTFDAVDLDRGGVADIAIADGRVRMSVEPGPPVDIDLTGAGRPETVQLPPDPKIGIGRPER